MADEKAPNVKTGDVSPPPSVDSDIVIDKVIQQGNAKLGEKGAPPELNDKVVLGNEAHVDGLAPPDTALGKVKRALTEGHTFGDAIMTVASAQIGQVLLTMPNALYKTGLTAGLISTLVSMLISAWTMYILAALFLERKRDLIKRGEWYNEHGVRARITQYHEVIGHSLGKPFGIFAQLVIILSLGGTSVAQIIACAGDVYVVDKSLSKRTYGLIFGAILMLFAFVPTFRHLRVLNVIALIGTSYTALFILITTSIKGQSPQADPGRGPISVQGYFNGAAVLVNALGGHSIALEMMDSMRKQKKFMGAFGYGWVWSLLLSIPHSISVNLAYPQLIAKNDNVFGLLPVTTALKVAVWLMVIHQAFVLPTLAFNWVYRKQERRDVSVFPPARPFSIANWKVAFVFNWVVFVAYLGFCGGAVYYAIKSIVDNAYTFGVFAECYQCPVGWQKKLG